MKHYRIDLRAQSLDINFFEDYFVLFKEHLNSFSKYSYSIEDDETIDRHLHAYIECDLKRSEDVLRSLTRNQFKPLMKTMVNLTQTTEKNFFHIEAVNKTPLKALGYTQKFNTKRKGHKGYTDDDIIKALEYYYTTEKYDKKHILDKTDWRKVNSRNFHSIVEEYATKNDLNISDQSIVERMVKDKFTFIDLPVKTIGRGFRELRIAHEDSVEEDLIQCKSEYHGLQDEDSKYINDIKDLSLLLNTLCKDGKLKPEDIPQHHKEICSLYI